MKKIRFIREWSDGNNLYKNISHWVEIQVFVNGINIAKNKKIEASFIPNQDVSGQSNLDIILDGNISLQKYVSACLDIQRNRPIFILIDLLNIYDVDAITLWHGWWDHRFYYTKLEVSEDGVNWETIYNWEIDGVYLETERGKTFYI